MLQKELVVAFRSLSRQPSFTWVAVLTLGLGIGLNGTVFTLANAVLMRDLPFRDGHEVMYVKKIDRERGDDVGLSYPEFFHVREKVESFEDVAAFVTGTTNLSDNMGVPERMTGTQMTINAFSLIGEVPILGRDFASGDDRSDSSQVTLISHSLWQTRYGGQENVLGQVIRVNQEPAVVIGVMRKGMKFPESSDVWTVMKVPANAELERKIKNLEVVARLTDDTRLEMARAELESVDLRIADPNIDVDERSRIAVLPYGKQFVGSQVAVLFAILMAAVGLVLVIACANVGNLVLARSAPRSREMSIRAALGAGRRRLIRQLLIESLVVGTLSGLCGLALSVMGVRLFDIATADVEKPYWLDFSIDLRVMGFLGLITTLTALVFSLAPAIQVSRQDLHSMLREGGGHVGSVRIRRSAGALVVVQVASALVLLFGAGLMLRSFEVMRHLDLGIAQDDLLTMRLALPEAKYPTGHEMIRFRQALEERLQGIRSVEVSSVTSHMPLAGGFRWDYRLAGQTQEKARDRPSVLGLMVGPEYFSALGVSLIQGRSFAERDGDEGAGVVIVNRAFANAHWEGGQAVGQWIELDSEIGRSRVTVVGVAPDIHQGPPQGISPKPVVYVPYRVSPRRFFSVLVRSRLEPGQLAAEVRRAIQEVDPDLPPYSVATIDDYLRKAAWSLKTFGTMLGLFALVALVLSAIGVYGVLSYSVSQRVREIGVRVAIGATGRGIIWTVLRSGLSQLALGFFIGVPLALFLGKTMAGMMVRVSPQDPVLLIGAAGFLALTGLAACVVPAWRAIRVDPAATLRR